MKITVVTSEENPLKKVAAAARTCYSTTPVLPIDLGKTKEDLIAFCKALFDAGHLTCFMHVNYTFLIEDVSRKFVWDVLHRTTFYNSEQVSQRYTYTELKGNVFLPNFSGTCPETAGQIESLYESVDEAYKLIVDALVESGLDKKAAQENARYILPVSCFTSLYYTVNLVTVIKIWRLCLHKGDSESLAFANVLKDSILELDDSLSFLFVQPEENKQYVPKTKELLRLEMQKSHPAQLVSCRFPADFMVETEALKDTVAGIRAFIQEEKPNGLDYGVNDYSNFLRRVFVVFQNCLSFVSDCQEQRHRTILQVRPSLEDTYSEGKRNFYIPPVIAENAYARSIFEKTVNSLYDCIDVLRSPCDGGDRMYVRNEWSYLLPNAHIYTIQEMGDLESFSRKWMQRLCYNAQEETRLLNQCQYKELARYCNQWLSNNGKRILNCFGPPCEFARDGGQKCREGKRSCLARGNKAPWKHWKD